MQVYHLLNEDSRSGSFAVVQHSAVYHQLNLLGPYAHRPGITLDLVKVDICPTTGNFFLFCLLFYRLKSSQIIRLILCQQHGSMMHAYILGRGSENSR